MSLAEVANILKHDYKNLETLMNVDQVLYAQVDRTRDSIVGDYAVIALEVGREFGTGFRLETDTMPPGRTVPPQNVQVKVKRMYGRYRITKAEISAMKTNVGAFTEANGRRVQNLKDSLSRSQALAAWGDGSGKLATCGTTTASTTVQLAATTPEIALVNFEEGKQIDIGTVADPQLIAADRRITAVDFANATVTIDGPAVTTTSSHFIFEQGGGGTSQSATQRALTGVARGVDDDTTLEGLDPATVTKWKAYVSGNSGVNRPPTENVIEKATHIFRQRGGRKTDGLYAGDGVYRSMINQLKGRQRSVDKLELKGGHTGIDYTFGAMNMPLVLDFDAAMAGANSLWGFDYSSMKMYVQEDWQWEDTDGSILRLATDDTHSFEAIYFTFREMGWLRRNSNWRLDDLEAA